MGKNVRYAHHYDKLMDDRILRQIAERGPLQSLTPEELELDRRPVTIDPDPKPIRAWVRFGPNAVRVVGVADRWTDVAVGIVFPVGDLRLKAWVWASAVSPVAQRDDEIARTVT